MADEIKQLGTLTTDKGTYNSFPDLTAREGLKKLQEQAPGFTDATKAEIAAMVIESLGGNPVFGYVDSDNSIVLAGNLPEGTYAVSYEMEDGSTIPIGQLVLSGDSDADDGGGEAIEPVTVSIELTNGVRISTTDGTDREQAGCCATPDIDLTAIPKPCSINLTGAQWCNNSLTDYQGYVVAYAKKADGAKLAGNYTTEGMADAYFTVKRNGDSNRDITVTVISEEVAFVRFSGIWTTNDATGTFEGASAALIYTPEA